MAWAPAYATVNELQSFMQDGTTSSTTELALAIETASRSVDRICNRQFGLVAAPEARYYTAEYHRDSYRTSAWEFYQFPSSTTQPSWTVSIDDLMTVTGLLVDVDNDGDNTYESSITDYALTPINAAVSGRPWTRLEIRSTSLVRPNGRLHGVRVTAKYGWSAVPDTVKMATLIQASRLFARRAAPFGLAGNPEVGQMRLLERLDPDLAVSLQPYIKRWGAV